MVWGVGYEVSTGAARGVEDLLHVVALEVRLEVLALLPHHGIPVALRTEKETFQNIVMT